MRSYRVNEKHYRRVSFVEARGLCFGVDGKAGGAALVNTMIMPKKLKIYLLFLLVGRPAYCAWLLFRD